MLFWGSGGNPCPNGHGSEGMDMARKDSVGYGGCARPWVWFVDSPPLSERHFVTRIATIASNDVWNLGRPGSGWPAGYGFERHSWGCKPSRCGGGPPLSNPFRTEYP